MHLWRLPTSDRRGTFDEWFRSLLPTIPFTTGMFSLAPQHQHLVFCLGFGPVFGLGLARGLGLCHVPRGLHLVFDISIGVCLVVICARSLGLCRVPRGRSSSWV